MKNLRAYGFFLLLGIIPLGIYAQAPAPAIERVTVFGENHNTASASEEKVIPEVTESVRPPWAVKFSPTLLTRGELPVFVERRLNPRYGLEGALGVTFEDYLKETAMQGKPLLQKNPNEDKLSGIVGKLALRYYLGKVKPTALYVGPQVDFKNYRKDVHAVYMASDGRYTAGKLRDQQTYMDFKCMLGYQTNDETDRDFYFDWFVGAGLRLGNEDNVVTDESNSNVVKVNHVHVFSPVITAGVKLGLGM